METNQLEEKLKKTLCEVRKAHRLLCEYQRRIQDLSWFIKSKLGFDKKKGRKQTKRKIDLPQHCIYWYAYEYYLGEQSIKENNKSWLLSIIQISDTGFNQNRGNGKEPTQVQTFASVDESESRILFYLSSATKRAGGYDWDPDEIIKEYAVQDGFFRLEEHPNHIQIVYSVPMWKFVDENATMHILRKFVDYCNKNAGTNLKIQE